MEDFDKTLTQAEKDAPTYLEWSDATLARCVRETAKQLGDEKGNKAMMAQAAFLIITGVMDEANAETLKVQTKGDRPGCTYKLNIVAKLTKRPA